MSKKVIHLLCSDADRAVLQPVLDALQAKGLRVSEKAPGKNDLVLAALSEAFYADNDKTDALLDLLAAGAENVLPLQLDGVPIPDAIKNALYARNIIPASGRDAAHTAERIADAIPDLPSIVPKLLIAGALVLAVIIGLLIWRGTQKGEAVPVMAETANEIYIPMGLTEEDLAAIEDVVIVGDYFGYFTDADFREAGEWLDIYWVAYDNWDEDGSHWYSKEDGHEYAMTPYDDLHFLELMPKLRFLRLVDVEADAQALPDLSGASLLESVSLRRCNIDSLEWLRGAKLQNFDAQLTQIADYSPLSDCARLQHAWIDLYHAADLSAFAPPQLQYLRLENGEDYGETDLSGLAACEKLSQVELGTLSLRDLDFLRDKPIRVLQLWDMGMLRDISALESLKRLEELEIQYCERITDYTPIAGCTALEHIHLQCDNNPDALQDASFLADLPKLWDIGLYSCNLNDLNFLEGKQDNGRLCLGFAGDIRDYSGLAYVKHYDWLHLNPRRADDSRFGDLSAVLPYLDGAEVKNLHLHDCGGIDLSLLPKVTESLEIWYGDLTDLSTLPDWGIKRLMLYDCQYLTSLDGIQSLPAYTQPDSLTLTVAGCPRLRGWSAIENASLSGLELQGVYSLPVFDGIGFGSLRLESIEELSDLTILSGLSDGHSYNSIELVGLDAISDLTPLRRLQIKHLEIPPQVADQAEELVEAGIVGDYEVAYPDGSWQPFDGAMELLSLDELDTLPTALLRRVERLGIAGDTLFDFDRYDIWEDWEHRDRNGNPALQLHDRETDAVTPLAPGVIADLDKLSVLTGLRELYLYGQPIQSLDGIQVFSSLEEFSAKGCAELTDASALFALPELRRVDLKCTQVDSIQGVQNLRELRSLEVSNTRVSDLTPLADCDLSAAFEDQGFDLNINELELSEEDFAAIGSIRRFQGLAFTDADPAVWIDALSDSEIHYFGAGGDLQSNEDLAAFVSDHPELRQLFLGWAEDITDLTPLLALENLERVEINGDMREAIASLDGQSCPWLEIRD